MANTTRMGVLRSLVVSGYNLDPAEGSEPTIVESGYSGETHMAGNGVMYKESNPHPGKLNTDVSCDLDMYINLKALQNAGTFFAVSCTTAGGEDLVGNMAVANSDGLELTGGVVSLELAGTLEAI